MSGSGFAALVMSLGALPPIPPGFFEAWHRLRDIRPEGKEAGCLNSERGTPGESPTFERNLMGNGREARSDIVSARAPRPIASAKAWVFLGGLCPHRARFRFPKRGES